MLRRADGDVDGVRDDIRDYVADRLGHTGAVLVIDDIGFIKKGLRRAGVQRQYTGTSGKWDNCQIGWYAHITLSVLALARLAAIRATEHHGSSAAH